MMPNRCLAVSSSLDVISQYYLILLATTCVGSVGVVAGAIGAGVVSIIGVVPTTVLVFVDVASPVATGSGVTGASESMSSTAEASVAG